METAKFDQQLSGAGPYTVFAPSDRAFEQLPPSALEELMKQENQAQLAKLLGHHVIQGQAITADDVLGQQTQVDTLSGDTLTVDGTSQVVLLVPTGLTITRVGDQVVIEREGVAVSAGAIEVEDQVVREAGGEQDQQTAARTPTEEASDMPMTEHQQEALKSEPGQEQQQTAPEGSSAMPATEHQRQVLSEGEQPEEQQAQDQQQAAAQTPTAEQSDMPMTEHQQEVLESEPAKEQQQTAPEGTAMPATEHQRQVLAEGDQQQAQGEQEQQTAARTPTAEGSDMPMTEHQQGVLESEPAKEQQQTAPVGTAMPATEHQRQVLAEEEMAGEQPQSHEQAQVEGKPDILREATVVSAGIEADNGVIHVIDAVLVPQEVLKMLEGAKQSQG
jgi:uncharacterized surface protein with fasciclin (FAS1) repeats